MDGMLQPAGCRGAPSRLRELTMTAAASHHSVIDLPRGMSR
jgi:hypothetical protein